MRTMVSFVVFVVLMLGVNTLIWSSVGCIRLIAARRRPARRRTMPDGYAPPAREQVAILIAAHNEELVIGQTLESLERAGHARNVFVVSDGSTDATGEIARAHGASVLDLNPNRGKAGAIVEAIREFDIPGRFEVVLLLDADTQLSPGYFDTGLPEFTGPDVVAVAGHASTLYSPRPPTLGGRLLVSYRERVYIAMQYLFKFGMAARYANVVPIVPGFASMYRTRILSDIDIAAQGLKIEDYNMTFEVHAKKLGRIAFHPGAAVAHTQDPDTLVDYAKQVQRWNLGFWQTVSRHGFQFRLFWLALALFIVELLVSCVALILVLPLIVASALGSLIASAGLDPSGTAAGIAGAVPVLGLVLGVALPDYFLSVIAAIISRQKRYLVYGLVFPAMRVVDALLCMVALFQSRFNGSTGAWKSPPRRSAKTEELPVGDSIPSEAVPAAS